MLETEIARIYIDGEGFCRIDLDSSEKDIMDVQDARNICEAIYKVCDGKPHKIITDTSAVSGHVGIGAREEIRDNKKMRAVRQAEAFVVKSLSTTLIANFYVKFNKPPNPTRVFSEMESAKKWLRSLEF